MNIKPLNNYVLVLPRDAAQKTAGGLIIPDNAKEQPQIGTVMAVGPGTADCPIEVEVGDVVCYAKYMGTEVEVESRQGLLLPMTAILATIDMSTVSREEYERGRGVEPRCLVVDKENIELWGHQ